MQLEWVTQLTSRSSTRSQ